MWSVKVLPKGRITLPIEVRRKLRLVEGDILALEESSGKITIKKRKTIHDYAGSLPKLEMSIEEMIEHATDEAVKDFGK